MKKINVEKTIENIDKRREENAGFSYTWEKEDDQSIWMKLDMCNNYEFGFSKDGEFLDGYYLEKYDFLRYYGDCVVYQGGENE